MNFESLYIFLIMQIDHDVTLPRWCHCLQNYSAFLIGSQQEVSQRRTTATASSYVLISLLVNVNLTLQVNFLLILKY